jgi:hypothetical protein
MPIHLIIDGYNLIRQSRTLSALDRQDIALGRAALVASLAAYRALKPHRITVVFDGAQAPPGSPERDRHKGVRILYSRAGESADAVIVRMARGEREKALVVSSDAAVAHAAEACGAAAVGSPEFEERISLALAMQAAGGAEDEEPCRRVSTRKKGEGWRLSKRARQERMKTAKL